MEKAILLEILQEQLHSLLRNDLNEIPRKISFERHLNSKEISVITGVRRCGKSSFLRQIARSFGETAEIHYLNFEDFRLIKFTLDDFAKAYELFKERTSRPNGKFVVMYDEVQEVDGWERWVTTLANAPDVKIFVTGSNSNMLSTELSTYLTGRHQAISVTPFSFTEVLSAAPNKLNDMSASPDSVTEKNQLRRAYLNFSIFGGFPRVFLSQDLTLLKQYFDDIVLKDITKRRKVRRIPELAALGTLLASQNTQLFNRSHAAKAIGIADQTTISKFCSYFVESYLFYEIKLFSRSKRSQIRSLSKFYAIDPILAQQNGYHHSAGSSWILENQVLVELKRRYSEIYYWHSRKNYEVDFIIREKDGSLKAIQVATTLENPETKERELRGLSSAFTELGVNEAEIITESESGEFEVETHLVKAIPFYKWAI